MSTRQSTSSTPSRASTSLGAAVLPPHAQDLLWDTAFLCRPPLSSPGDPVTVHASGLRSFLLATLRDCGAIADTVPSGLSGGPRHPAWAFRAPSGQHTRPLLLPLSAAAACPPPAGARGRHSRVHNPAPRGRHSRSSLRRPPNPSRRHQRQAPARQHRRRGRTALRSLHRSALAAMGWRELVGLRSVQALLGLCWSAAEWAASAGQLKAGIPCQPSILWGPCCLTACFQLWGHYLVESGVPWVFKRGRTVPSGPPRWSCHDESPSAGVWLVEICSPCFVHASDHHGLTS